MYARPNSSERRADTRRIDHDGEAVRARKMRNEIRPCGYVAENTCAIYRSKNYPSSVDYTSIADLRRPVEFSDAPPVCLSHLQSPRAMIASIIPERRVAVSRLRDGPTESLPEVVVQLRFCFPFTVCNHAIEAISHRKSTCLSRDGSSFPLFPPSGRQRQRKGGDRACIVTSDPYRAINASRPQ